MILTEQKEIRRLAVYCFHDAQGVVDRCVPCLLDDLRANCTELCVVVSGPLCPAGRESLSSRADRLLERKDEGFEAAALREALASYGPEALAGFDELVIADCRVMGPLRPLAEMFADMDRRDLDFWGLCRQERSDTAPFDPVPAFIPTGFLAVRRSLLCTDDFRRYWESLPPMRTREDARRTHEQVFAGYFADRGYRSDVYCEGPSLHDRTLLLSPALFAGACRCPLFLRESFSLAERPVWAGTVDSGPAGLLEMLRRTGAYDPDMVWEHILRTCHMADVKNALELQYILPLDERERPAPSRLKTALVLHLYYEELIESCFRYALSLPETGDVIVTVGSPEKKAAVEAVFRKGPWNSVRVLLIENRGRDVSALLVAAAPYLKDYDCVCFAHDKKVTYLSWEIVGAAFAERCFANLLGSPDYVQNVLALFECEPRLGMLIPPPPIHASYYPTLGCEWYSNYDNTLALHRRLGLHCPIDREKEPVAPLGTMFWFRPAALAKLLDRGWRYEDFPPEPNGTDGTFLHAVERIYGFVAQDAGYYAAWTLTDRYAEEEWNRLRLLLREGTGSLAVACSPAEDAPADSAARRLALKDGKPTLWPVLKNRLRRLLPGASGKS